MLIALLSVQSGPDDEIQLRRRCAAALASFARLAERHLAAPVAAAAYREILDHYDAEHRQARDGLGYRRTRSGWKPPRRRPEFVDRSEDSQRRTVAKAWRQLRRQLAGLHRKFGLAMIDTDAPLGRRHLRRAIVFDPFDQRAHDRLGHQRVRIGGREFRGSAEELQFIGNMQRLEGEALRLARRHDQVVVPVLEIPRELSLTGAEFVGARSKNFTVFTLGTAGDAADTVRWAERGLEFLRWNLGPGLAAKLEVEARQRRYWAWQGFVWTELQGEDLVAKNLEHNRASALAKHLRTAGSEAARRRFGNIQWFAAERCREVVQKLTPAAMHDRMISSCWEIGIGLQTPASTEADGSRRPAGVPNWPLVEGALHAATWLLKSTLITQRGALPSGTSAVSQLRLPDSVHWWRRRMRDAALAGIDMPIVEVARQRSSAFPNAARLKTWSFMTYLMARFPKRWYRFLIAVPGDRVPFAREVEKAAQQALGQPLAQIEADWRAWASGRSVTALATGYGEPLAPALPSRQQLAGLARLNQVRAAVGLRPCRLDAEATLACVEHAHYLARYPDQHRWPAAHQQDPDRPGFTPRGMRCAMRSVIVFDAGSAASSIDGWMGTIFHRLPLLSPELPAVGLAFEKGICVLDVGSLAGQPQVDAAGQPLAADWLQWPAADATEVPRQFAFYELPNPLGDQPAPDNRDDAAGYPVSLTLARHLHPGLRSADIHLYRVKRRGASWQRQDEVKLHVHTPQRPLLARNQTQDTVFGIPFRPLARRTTYQAVVTLRSAAGTKTVEWQFTTDGRSLRRAPRPR